MKDTKDPVRGLLSLAAKAGKVKTGAFLTEEALRKGKACVVLLAEDAAGNTREKTEQLCKQKNVPLYLYGTKESLGRNTGKEERSVVAVTDPSFGRQIQVLLGKKTEEDSL